MNTEWKIHNPNGSRRPAGVKADQKVHVRGGGQELVATADRVDWRNVAFWRDSEAELTKIADTLGATGCAMSKHTPGPWDYGWEIQPNGCPTVGHKGLMVCTVAHSAKHPEQKETALANADLISAAPDLLEALQRLMFNDCPITGNPTYEQLVEHWEYEDAQGRGEAQDQLFALRAVAKALGK